MLQPGDRLDHYVVDAFVGGGGMARVYRVRHAVLDTTMALKVLSPELVGQERIRRRFLAEGRIMARVRHPAIVMVTDAVIDPSRGVAGLVMEYVEGPDLARVIARMKGPPAPAFVRDVMLPVLDGLHHVHREGVIHRDLKPANVLLSRDAGGRWHPRVTDFGVAWVARDARLTRTRPPSRDGALVGTPAYMAPEQARGEGGPDPRWDVWALGVVLYELATGGVHPFEQGDADGTLAAVRRGTCTPVTRVHPGIEPDLAAAIAGALQPDPARRIASAAALAEVLVGGREVSAPTDDAAFDAGTAVVDAPTAALEIARGPGGPTRLPLPEHARVGSDPDADVTLPYPGVEAVHCEILHQDGRWVLLDRSAAGTRVNGARMDRVQLADGDLVRLGAAVVRFRLEAPEVAPPPAPPAPPPPAGPSLAWRDAAGERRVALGLVPLVLGSGAAADVRVDHPSVSPRHARVSVQGRDVLVEDLMSEHGTRVNGQRTRFRRVVVGDTLHLGEVVLRLRA